MFIEKWLSFLHPVEQIKLEIKNEVKEKDRQSLSVEAFWIGDTQEIENIQLDMQLNETSIECSWKPHLSPEEAMVVGDLFFYSPTMVFEKEDQVLALIPDLDSIERERKVPYYMDYTKEKQHIFFGRGHYEKTYHVYHRRTDQSFKVEKGQSLFKFYLVQWDEKKERRNLRPVTNYLWEKFGRDRMKLSVNENSRDYQSLEKYAKYTYDWAFKQWEEIVWQEFKINQKDVGANVLIVRTAQKPGLGNEDSWREKKSIWNQAWFSSLRSAYGYYQWGKYWQNDDFIRRANLAKQFALSAPQINGLFPAVFTADEDLNWDNGSWGHSNRRPEHHDDYGHILDMSWTAYWMLKWYQDIEKDSHLLDYCLTYAERLLELQDDKGYFPAWVHMENGHVSEFLKDSPESSISVAFLAKLFQISDDQRYLTAAKNAMSIIEKEVIPEGRWEDFETYWSCSRTWEGKVYGEKEPRSGLYNQCNFSIYWTTEAYKELYKITQEKSYLDRGEQVLAELSLYQAIWNPEFVGLPVLGGFSVMNTDDEWNDARQSLFALTYDDYYQLTGKEEYALRSYWAMRASYYMMYCPENEKVKALYEKTFPYMDSDDYGFEMENAHHGDNIDHMGEFTIFDWGNGSASASLIELILRSENKTDTI